MFVDMSRSGIDMYNRRFVLVVPLVGGIFDDIITDRDNDVSAFDVFIDIIFLRGAYGKQGIGVVAGHDSFCHHGIDDRNF